MEKFKLKILNPRSSEIRRRFGNSLKSLFNLADQAPIHPQDQYFKKRSLVNRLKVSTSSRSKENSLTASESNITPVKKLKKPQKFVFSSCEKINSSQSWLKPRDPFAQKTSRRFWSSLDMPINCTIKERKRESPDAWSSYNSTPIEKERVLETVTQEDMSSNSSFYSMNSSECSSFYSVQSFYSINTGNYSINTSVCSTPIREADPVFMDCDEELKSQKRRIFRAVRK